MPEGPELRIYSQKCCKKSKDHSQKCAYIILIEDNKHKKAVMSIAKAYS